MKIIHVMNHPPPYELYRESRPEIHWLVTTDAWVGIWRTEWAYALAHEIRKVTDEYEIEVWQPDLRADRIYEHRFANGLLGRIIPARPKPRRYGLKRTSSLHSPLMIRLMAEQSSVHEVIFHFHGNLAGLSIELLARVWTSPVIFSIHGTVHLPNVQMFRIRWNFLASVSDLRDYLHAREALRNVSLLTYMNDKYCDQLQHLYRGPKIKLTMGCDFDFWRKLDKRRCRRELNLPKDRLVLFWSSRLNADKQIDRFIAILNQWRHKDNFVLVISGHGTPEFEAHLRDISSGMFEKGMLRFTGFLGDEELRRYYSACDLFVLTSKSEGASVAVIKALACETPVFATKVGNTSEILLQHGAGTVVGTTDYSQWKQELENILDGKRIRILERAIAKRLYHWPNIARQFIDLYEEVTSCRNGIRTDNCPQVIEKF